MPLAVASSAYAHNIIIHYNFIILTFVITSDKDKRLLIATHRMSPYTFLLITLPSSYDLSLSLFSRISQHLQTTSRPVFSSCSHPPSPPYSLTVFISQGNYTASQSHRHHINVCKKNHQTLSQVEIRRQ